MKKKLAIIAMIVLLCTALVLCACDDTDNNGGGTSVACNCPNCHDGVCSCDQCKGDTTIPEINRAEVKIGKDATYYSGSDNQEFSAVAYYVFEPKYTSDYTIAWDKNVAELKINGTPITLSEEQKSVKRRLVGGQKYEIDASMGKFSLAEYPITLSVTPEDYQTEVSLTKDEEYIIRIPKSSSYKDVKTFTFGENVVINTVLKVNENGALVDTREFEFYEHKENTVDILYGDDNYFVVISSEQNVSAKVSTSDVEELKWNANTPITLTLTENGGYKFFKFVFDAGTYRVVKSFKMVMALNGVVGEFSGKEEVIYSTNWETAQIDKHIPSNEYTIHAREGIYLIGVKSIKEDVKVIDITIEIVD